MILKTLAVVVLVASTLTFFIKPAEANSPNCANRYVTLVNPIRSRALWFDNTLKPIHDQYGAIKEHNLAATWLLQYDTFFDAELVGTLKNFDQNQEKGLFLEVSPKLADEAKVIYNDKGAWWNPSSIFLSGYKQSDRRKLIDRDFNQFKQIFGYFPKAVGAWWIDSYSLNYLKDKYQANAAMIVADQLTTDHYGVWGQWWGVPYFPSQANILTPSLEQNNKHQVVITQWAQRDLSLASSEGPKSSNHSLQANDYLSLNLGTDYFQQLVEVYLDCRNQLGQVTVGLETGQESVGGNDEYVKQLNVLSKIPDIHFVTLSKFADQFRKIYQQNPKQVVLSDQHASWILTLGGRSNSNLSESLRYDSDLAFFDYFLPDKADNLDRKLPIPRTGVQNDLSFIWLIIVAILGIIFVSKGRLAFFLGGLFYNVAAFGLILRSEVIYGYRVYYSIPINQIFLVQALLVLLIFSVIWWLDFLLVTKKLIKRSTLIFLLYSCSIIYGLDYLTSLFRYSYLENRHILGLTFNGSEVFGFWWEKTPFINLFSQDFNAATSAALRKIDLTKYYNNPKFFVIYLLANLFIGLFLGYLLLRLPQKIRIILVIILSCLFIGYLSTILNSDPQSII